MSAAIHQLAVSNHLNNFINRQVSYDYKTYESINNRVLINKDADTFLPEYLKLEFSNTSISMSDVKKLVLVLKINGRLVHQFPLSLLMNLNDPIEEDGNMYINLCFDMFLGEIILIGLQFADVVFEILHNNDTSDSSPILSKFSIIGRLTYVDMEERRSLARNHYETVIQQISWINVNSVVNESNIYNLSNLPFEGISKGVFIECEHINSLRTIELTFNERERFKLDRFLIRIKCKKINNNLLYFPFNDCKEYIDRTMRTFIGSPNLSRFDRYGITLTFEESVQNISIYSLQSNVYTQSNGSGRTEYTTNVFYSNYCLSELQTQTRIVPQSTQTRIWSLLQETQPRIVTQIFPRNSIQYGEPVTKPILNNNNICPITFEIIKLGDAYMSCNQCNNNFSEESIKKCLDNRIPKLRNCPTCRTTWSTFERYINGDGDI
jgi:hypothetical protein